HRARRPGRPCGSPSPLRSATLNTSIQMEGAAMPQHWVPAVFLRGGTSKGLFFHAEALPGDPAARDRLLLPPWAAPTRSAASSTDGRRYLVAVHGGRDRPPDTGRRRRRLHLRPGGGGATGGRP